MFPLLFLAKTPPFLASVSPLTSLAKTPPLPCASTDFAAKTAPLPCVATALPWLRHRLCLVAPRMRMDVVDQLKATGFKGLFRFVNALSSGRVEWPLSIASR